MYTVIIKTYHFMNIFVSQQCFVNAINDLKQIILISQQIGQLMVIEVIFIFLYGTVYVHGTRIWKCGYIKVETGGNVIFAVMEIN